MSYLSQITAVLFVAIIIVSFLVMRIYKWRKEAVERSDYDQLQNFAGHLSKMSYARIQAKTGRCRTEAHDTKQLFLKTVRNMQPPPETSWW
jgi:hypothetical protein